VNVRVASIAETLIEVLDEAMGLDVEVESVVFYDLDQADPDAVPGETGADRIEVAGGQDAARRLAEAIDTGHTARRLGVLVLHECEWHGRTVTIIAKQVTP